MQPMKAVIYIQLHPFRIQVDQNKGKNYTSVDQFNLRCVFQKIFRSRDITKLRTSYNFIIIVVFVNATTANKGFTKYWLPTI